MEQKIIPLSLLVSRRGRKSRTGHFFSPSALPVFIIKLPWSLVSLSAAAAVLLLPRAAKVRSQEGDYKRKAKVMISDSGGNLDNLVD